MILKIAVERQRRVSYRPGTERSVAPGKRSLFFVRAEGPFHKMGRPFEFPMGGSRRRGAVGMMLVLFLFLLLGSLSSTIMLQATEKYRQGARMRTALALEMLCQSGVERARAELRRAPGWTGAGPLTLEPGEVELRVERMADNACRVRVRAAVPSLENPAHSLEREVLLNPASGRVTRVSDTQNPEAETSGK